MIRTLNTEIDKSIFFNKIDILNEIGEYVKSKLNNDSLLIEDEDIYLILEKKAKSINSSLDWSTAKIRPIDIIKYFRKYYKIRYVPFINWASGDYYVFSKKRYLFF